MTQITTTQTRMKHPFTSLEDCQELPNFSVLNLLDEIYFHYEMTSPHFYRFNLHKQRSLACSEHKFFYLFRCERGHKEWQPLPCGSFFDEECNKYYAERQRAHLRDYVADYPHRSITFTLPSEVWSSLSFEKGHYEIKGKNSGGLFLPPEYIPLWHLNKSEDIQGDYFFMLSNNGFVRLKFTPEFNKLYFVVKKTLDEYFNNHVRSSPVQYGAFALPHPYGSQDMEFKPHLNIELCTRAFCDGNFISIEFLPGTEDKTGYDLIREIYKRNIEETFNIKMTCSPEVRFNEELNKPLKSIGKISGYFKNTPFRSDHVLRVTDTSVIFTTNKRLQEHMSPLEVSHEYFYDLIAQHIPPVFYRMARSWGFYNSNHKYHSDYRTVSQGLEEFYEGTPYYLFRWLERPQDLCLHCGGHMKLELICHNSRVYLAKDSTLSLTIKASDLGYIRLEDLPERYKPPPDAYETDHRGFMSLEMPRRTTKNIEDVRQNDIRAHIKKLRDRRLNNKNLEWFKSPAPEHIKNHVTVEINEDLKGNTLIIKIPDEHKYRFSTEECE